MPSPLDELVRTSLLAEPVLELMLATSSRQFSSTPSALPLPPWLCFSNHGPAAVSSRRFLGGWGLNGQLGCITDATWEVSWNKRCEHRLDDGEQRAER
jgi:hypothetical protein